MILPGPKMMVGNPAIDLPLMTSDTTPSGHVAVASSVADSRFEAFRAFDGNTIFQNGTWCSANGQHINSWVKRSASLPFRVKKYALRSMSDNAAVLNRCPTSFRLEGSTDDVNFTTVDTRSSLSWSLDERKEFTVATPGFFQHYRVFVLATGGATFAAIAELELLQG